MYNKLLDNKNLILRVMLAQLIELQSKATFARPEIVDLRCHHKVPLENDGTDKYSNLVLVTEAVHLLIHATLEETIQKYLKQLQLNKKQLEKLNKLRKLAGTSAIV